MADVKVTLVVACALVDADKRASHHQCELEIGHGDYDL